MRKIVTALKMAGRDANAEIVERILEGNSIPLKPASPYGLILLDVRYSFEFEREEKAFSMLQRKIEENMRKYAQFYGVFRFLR